MSDATLPDPRIGFFNRIAAEWDAAEQDPAETIRRLEAISDLLALRPGQQVLEVGCGTGQLTGWLADRVRPGAVVGVDFSPGMLQQARAKGLEAELRLADVCRDELGPAQFDLALCFHSFPHFRDQARAVENLAGVLQCGGRLLVVHLNSRAEVNAFHDQVGGAVAGDHLPDQPTWDTLLSPVGLRRTHWIDREGLFFLEAIREIVSPANEV